MNVMQLAREAAVRCAALLPQDELSWKVLMAIALHVDREGVADPGPGQRFLWRMTGSHPKHIGRALRRLEAAGLLEFELGTGPGRPSRYWLPWAQAFADQMSNGPALSIVHNRAPQERAHGYPQPRALEARAEQSTSARPARALEARGSARPLEARVSDQGSEEKPGLTHPSLRGVAGRLDDAGCFHPRVCTCPECQELAGGGA